MEEVKHQQCFLQTFSSHSGHFFVVEQINQGLDVVTAHHGAQQFSGLGFADQRNRQVAMRNCRQERGLDFGCIVNARWHTVSEQIHQKGFFTLRWIFDEFN